MVTRYHKTSDDGQHHRELVSTGVFWRHLQSIPAGSNNPSLSQLSNITNSPRHRPKHIRLNCRSELASAIEYYKETKGLFQQLAMNIREWYSNSKEFISQLPQEDIGKDASPKVLGLMWNTTTDTFSCPGFNDLCGEHVTKRSLLQSISTLFDPCGFFGPVMVQARLLIQDLWKAKSGWDQKIPEVQRNQARQVCEDLAKVEKIQIGRCLPLQGAISRHQLHCFADASKKAYGAAVYLRSTDGDCTRTRLIFCKFRLAPIKDISLPRLELLAAVIGSRMLNFVRAELDLNCDECVLWSDSECVLNWLQTSKLLTVFVENRIRELRAQSNVTFRYVPSQLNPADIVSRGMTCDELQSSMLWWYGPWLLRLEKDRWPENSCERPKTLHEVRSTVALAQVCAPPASILEAMDMTRYSSYSKLLRVTAYVLRFAKRRRAQSKGVTVQELREAEFVWIRAIQLPLQLDLQSKKQAPPSTKSL